MLCGYHSPQGFVVGHFSLLMPYACWIACVYSVVVSWGLYYVNRPYVRNWESVFTRDHHRLEIMSCIEKFCFMFYIIVSHCAYRGNCQCAI